MKMKKILAMGASFALVAALAIGGTMAYLTTPEQSKSNVFTVGDVSISLEEETGVFGEGGTVKSDDDGAAYTEVMPGDYLQKEVTVTNTGNHDAYVQVTVTMNNAVAINNAIDDTYEIKDADGVVTNPEKVQEMYDYIFDGWGLNYTKVDADNNQLGMRLTISGDDMPDKVLKVDTVKALTDYVQFATNNWFKSDTEANTTNNFTPGLGKSYYSKNLKANEIRYTYYIYLAPDESTTLFNGLNVPAEFTNEQMKMFEGLEIDIVAKAIQADNMSIAEQYKDDKNGKAKTAFAILAGDIEVPEYSGKPSGKMNAAYTSADRIWGEHSSNAKVSHVIKLYSGDIYMGETSLNNIDGIIDGDVTVTWNIKLNPTNDPDSYWSAHWEKAPTIDMQPDRAELWVDGVKVDESTVQLNGPDNLKKIVGAVVDANGTILRYVVNGTEAGVQDGEMYVPFVSSNDELNTAFEDDNTTVVLGDGNYIIPDSAKNKTLTIIGNGNTVIATQDDGSYEGCDYSLEGSTATFKNITINTDSTTYTGYARLNATYENCIINGTYTLYGNSIFKNCEFNVTGDVYNIWTWGAPDATFNSCTFNSDGKAMLLYGTVNTNLEMNDCVFNDNGGLTDLKAAIEIGNDYGTSYTLTVNNTIVNGYEINDKGINTGTTLWANKNSMGTDKLNVVVDGVDVY